MRDDFGWETMDGSVPRVGAKALGDLNGEGKGEGGGTRALNFTSFPAFAGARKQPPTPFLSRGLSKCWICFYSFALSVLDQILMWAMHLDGYLKICFSIKRKHRSIFWPLAHGLGAGLCLQTRKDFVFTRELQGRAERITHLTFIFIEIERWQSRKKESHHLQSVTCVPSSTWTLITKIFSEVHFPLVLPALFIMRDQPE